MTPVSNANTDQTQPTGTTDPTSGSSGSSSNSSVDQLTNESTFLQLLVAQIKNQDPLNPTDSIQFVGQLVSFSQLEQLLNINQNIQALAQDGKTPSSSSTTGS
jgi:flagellar basal-body rod modification protein FlgD